MRVQFLFLASAWIPFLLAPLAAQDDDPGEQAVAESLMEVFRTSGKVSYKQEATMGETIALDAFNRFGRLTKDTQLLQYVAMVGNTVARVSDRPNTPYFFAVCENPDPNAFAVPGGYVFVTTGLLKLIRNEEELAGVLGHEISHITLQHAIKGIRAAKRWGAGLQIVTLLLTKGDEEASSMDYSDIIDMAVERITENGHGYRHEVRADEHGMEFAYRAGYRAEGLRDFLATLAGLEKGHKKIALLKTHRDNGKRVAELDKLIKKRGYRSIPINPNLATRFNSELYSRLR